MLVAVGIQTVVRVDPQDAVLFLAHIPHQLGFRGVGRHKGAEAVDILDIDIGQGEGDVVDLS